MACNKQKITPSNTNKSNIVFVKESDKIKTIKIGDRFGRLTVEGFELRGKNSVLISRCDCGNEKVFWRKSAIKNQDSCGCGINSNGITGKQRRSWTFRYQGYKNGAKKRNYEWSLSITDFMYIASKPCFFCGQEPKEWECFSNAPSVRKDSPIANAELYKIKISGIDRLNNNIGYTIDNSVPCCVYCNRAKSDLSMDNFFNHITKIYKWLSTKDKKQ